MNCPVCNSRQLKTLEIQHIPMVFCTVCKWSSDDEEDVEETKRALPKAKPEWK